MGGGGSGGPTQTTSTVTNSNLPEYARPYYEDLMNRTGGVAQRPYESYTGPRIQGFNNDQSTAFSMTRDIAGQGTPDLDTARGVTGTATSAALGTTGYQSSNINTPMWDGSQASNYMDPYMTQVVDRQKQAAVRDFNEGQSARDDPAIRSGAFGGYRDRIAGAVAQRGLANRLADIEATGDQSAYENAQQQFERDRAAGFTTAATNESNRRSAAGVQQQGAALGLQGATTYGGLASTEQGLGLQAASALGQAGQQQQQLGQQSLDTAYNDFVNQRDYERQNLNWYSSILRGVPVSAQSEVVQNQNINPMNQYAGLGIAALGAARNFA